MSTVKYQLRVKGLTTPDGTIPVRALVELLQGLVDTAERGLRLAIQGESVKRGKVPSWVGKAIDLNLTGLKTGSTVLAIEARTFGDTIGAQLQSQEQAFNQVAPTDTALSLVSRSVKDATAENLESNYYDAGVLNGLLELKGFFKNYASTVELCSEGQTQPEFVLSAPDMEKVEKLKKGTPEPQAFVVSGLLDEIERSNRRFHLLLSDGRVIPGRVDEEFMTVEGLRDLWGKPVTIKGVVYFKPSGKVQLLEAHMVRPTETGDEIFNEMPVADASPDLFDTSHLKPGYVSPFKEIRGMWPGDESIEQILEALRAS
jgi:hypothetical protein